MMKNTLFCIFFYVLNFRLIRSSCLSPIAQCGCPYEEPLRSRLRVVGGQQARDHSWPWVVSIRKHSDQQFLANDFGYHFCGGTIINEEYVLTAAHCFSDANLSLLSQYFVVVGAHYLTDTNPIPYKIKSVRLYEKYDASLYLHDIALVKLSRKIDFNDWKVGFICLPPKGIPNYPYEPMSGFAAGWGNLKENGSLSNTLQQVELPIVSHWHIDCGKLIVKNKYQFCAGPLEGGKDTCQGDSGGPLMKYNLNSGQWAIIGITSHGNGCAQANQPGVYTRVSMYVDWIESSMQNVAQSFTIQKSVLILSLLFCIFSYYK